jgi:hypothetical protein
MWRSDKWRTEFLAYITTYYPEGVANFLFAMADYQNIPAPTTKQANKVTKHFGALQKGGLLDQKSADGIIDRINNITVSGGGVMVGNAPPGVFDALHLPQLYESLFNDFMQIKKSKQ